MSIDIESLRKELTESDKGWAFPGLD
jgi:hypothetical protein